MKLTFRQIAQALYIALQGEKNTPRVIKNFWRYLQRHKLTAKLDQILIAFDAVYRENNPTMSVTIESARALPPQILDEIKDRLKKYHPKKNIHLETVINPEIIGGIKITLQQMQLDLSIKNQLQKLKEQI